MSYIGAQPPKGQYRKLRNFEASFDGILTSFQLEVDPGGAAYYVIPGSANQLIVSLGGVIQEPNVDYTVSSSQITFTTAPAGGLNCFIIQCGDALNIGVPSDGTVSASKLNPAGGLEGQTFVLDSSLQFAFAYVGGATGGRNRIINGDMRIDQRNAGAPVTVNNSAAFYATDRWFGFGMTTAGVFTLNRSTVAPTGFTNSLAASCTTADASIAAGDRYFVNQAIEGFNAADLGFGAAGAQAVALSFWVQSSLTGTYCAALINSAGNRSYVAEYSIAVANTWEYKTIYIPGDTTGTWLSDNGIGVGVRFTLATGTTYQTTANAWAAGNFNATSNQVNWMSSSSSRTFRITGVQLEAGTVATPFERRSFGQELSLCQRYFQRGAYRLSGVCNGAGGDASIVFPTPFRSSPTLTVNTLGAFVDGFATINITALTLGSTQETASRIVVSAASSTAGRGMVFDGSNLSFNAEL